MDQASPVEVPAAAQTNLPSDSVAALEAAGTALEATDVDILQAASQVDKSASESLQHDHINGPATISNEDGMPSNQTPSEASAMASQTLDPDDTSDLTQAVIPGQEAQAQSSVSLVQPSKSTEPAPESPGLDPQIPENSDALPKEELDSDPATAATDIALQASPSSSPLPDETPSNGMQPDTAQPPRGQEILSAEASAASGDSAMSVAPSAALAMTKDAEADQSAVSNAAAAEVPSMTPDGSMAPAERASNVPASETTREAESGVSGIEPESVPDVEQVKFAAQPCMDVPCISGILSFMSPPGQLHQPVSD